jgi:hypothetical protein
MPGKSRQLTVKEARGILARHCACLQGTVPVAEQELRGLRDRKDLFSYTKVKLCEEMARELWPHLAFAEFPDPAAACVHLRSHVYVMSQEQYGALLAFIRQLSIEEP